MSQERCIYNSGWLKQCLRSGTGDCKPFRPAVSPDLRAVLQHDAEDARFEPVSGPVPGMYDDRDRTALPRVAVERERTERSLARPHRTPAAAGIRDRPRPTRTPPA